MISSNPSFFYLLCLLPLLWSACAANDTTLKRVNVDSKPTIVLEIYQANISSDCTIRPSVTINGTSPGPELRFKEGEHVKIRVINRLHDSNTTIHFHGLSQFGSPFADGTAKISQFAIDPNGGAFDYEFAFELGSAGTYIYHAHVGFQLATAYGALIVEEATPPPYKYDEEIVLLFGDYFHATELTILEGLDAKPFKWLGEPQSVVVNGQALASCDPKSIYGCTSSCHHHVASVKPDKVYRVRVIGITALTYLYFGIEDHPNLVVIEADGGYTKPAQTDHMQLHSGQRYSFLLKTKSVAELKHSGAKRDFWTRIESRYRPLRDRGAFVLRYEDKFRDPRATDLSQTNIPSLNDFQKLVALPNEGENWITELFEPLNAREIAPTSAQVTRRIIINVQQRTLSDGSIKWFVNDDVYVETEPELPFLIRAYTNGLKPNYEAAIKNHGYDKDLGAYPIKLNEIIEFVFINCASTKNVTEAHPWHFHGRKAFMIAQGTGDFNDHNLAIAEAKFKKSHILRDTQVLQPGLGASYTNTTAPAGTVSSWMVLRMTATDSGAFLFHCHTQPHAVMGMAFVVLIDIEHLPPLPEDMHSMLTQASRFSLSSNRQNQTRKKI